MSEERTKYYVHKANIMDDDGVKRKDGEIVSLTSKTARHYNKLGFLRPFLEDDEEEEDDEPIDNGVGQQTPAQFVRARRTTPEPQATSVQGGSTTKSI